MFEFPSIATGTAARTRDPNSLTAGAGDKGDNAEKRTPAKAGEGPRTSPLEGRQAGDTGRQSEQLVATIRAYRKTGGAVVTIARAGRAPHHHRISLHRYAALREWTITPAARRWRTSDAWLRSSIAVSLWETGA